MGEINIYSIPSINAGLNSTSALLLILGYFFIRKKRSMVHRFFVLTAFVLSLLFLGLYGIYHMHVGHVGFEGSWVIKSIYFPILFTHTIFAAAVPPLVVTSLFFAMTKRYTHHRRIARWAMSLWLYVCVSGVAVFCFLRPFYPTSYLVKFRIHSTNSRENWTSISTESKKGFIKHIRIKTRES